jgi:para-aminobenzoate synthetase/4-amino-4-deoxychorismate lyase
MSLNGSILFESYAPDGRERSYAFADPVGEVVAMEFSQVRQALVEVERAVGEGLHAAGFLCYEAAPGLDSALVAGGKGELPLVYFALCERREEGADRSGTGTYELGAWAPSVSRSDYETDIERIRAYIAAGDTYQVNYTLRLRSGFQGDARALYRDMCLAQEAAFCAYFDLGRHVLLSASPELFFRLREGRFTARPMKGTRPRGRWSEEDLQLAVELRESPKDRAENVMITDLLRNDLGRISEVGSVEVPALWEAERYPTVWQMTSTVESRLKAGVALPEIFAALFPCGSVTGAPKVRTMEIIAELEREPRGIYTGCMGYISPGNEACFNVAIRTAHLDRAKGQLEFGVGGGITWGSSPEGEYEECLVKARVLGMRRPKFELLETLLYEGGAYFLLERHLQRLAQSAEYWGYKCDADAVRAHLDDEANRMGDNSFRVRLLLKKEGDMDVECHALAAAQTLKVALADEAVDSGDPFLYHKTTHRAVYERQLSAHADCDDVVLYNERGELTECCIGNLVLEREGTRHTPPVSSGLLAGTFREWLLERGEIREKVLKIGDLERSDALYLISSVRRWVALELV